MRAVGGYTDFALMEDYLLWAKMIVAGARVANVAEPLVRYRVGAGAYARRGGLAQLRAELAAAAAVLPRWASRPGRSTCATWSCAVAYRLVPETGAPGLAYRTRVIATYRAVTVT